MPLVAVLLLVVGLLVALLAVPAVAGHPEVPLVVLVVRTAVVRPAVPLEVSLGELAAFGAFVLVVGLVAALLRDFHRWCYARTLRNGTHVPCTDMGVWESRFLFWNP